MVRVIEKHNGTVNAFIGDSIMVLFGAPYTTDNDSLRAVNCALDMQKELKKFNRENAQKTYPN